MANKNLPFVPTEHLQPQISLQSMQEAISSNYNATENYYNQRREMLLRLLQSKGIQMEANFKKDIEKIVQNSWRNLIKQFQAMLNLEKGSNEYNMRFQQITQDFPLLNQELIESMLVSPDSFYQKRGFVFEDFLNNYVFSTVLDTGNSFASAHANNLVSQLIGKETSKSSVTKTQTYGRSDILIKLESMKFNTVNGVFQETSYKQGIPLELQGKLTVDYSTALPETSKPLEAERLAKKLLGRTGSFFGFQAKTYSNLKDARWMNSSVMKNNIDSVFNQVDSKGSRHTWENEYAGVYTTYFLSHQLMAIINPVNVALVSGSNFYWIDNILSSRRFYMQVSMSQWSSNHKATQKNTGFPQIKNDAILFTNYGAQTKGFKETIIANKETGIVRVTLR